MLGGLIVLFSRMAETDLTCNLKRENRWGRSYFAKGGGWTCFINMAGVQPGSQLNAPWFPGEKAGLCAIADWCRSAWKPWVAHHWRPAVALLCVVWMPPSWPVLLQVTFANLTRITGGSVSASGPLCLHLLISKVKRFYYESCKVLGTVISRPAADPFQPFPTIRDVFTGNYFSQYYCTYLPVPHQCFLLVRGYFNVAFWKDLESEDNVLCTVSSQNAILVAGWKWEMIIGAMCCKLCFFCWWISTSLETVASSVLFKRWVCKI